MLPNVMRNRNFALFWPGVIFSEIGTRGTVAATFFHVYALTDSLALTGLVGGAQAVALLLLSPLGGAIADRIDRRRLLQCSQGVSMTAATVLAVLTLTGAVQVWHIVGYVLIATAASSFDAPARTAIVPVLVPREQLGETIALLNPSRELAILVGPALAGVLIAVGGPGLMYLFDAVTYAVLVVTLAFVKVPPLPARTDRPNVARSIVEGAVYVARKPLILSLMAIDLVATLGAGYRVLLPAIADMLEAGPTGYGLLSAAPSAGALLATYGVFRVVKTSERQGRVLLVSTALYGLSAILLAQSQVLWLALGAGLLLGAFDAMSTTIRHTAVQLDTPDEVRGRVTSIYQMNSRGGPAIGNLMMGSIAAALGTATALTLGGLVPVVAAAAFWASSKLVRDYTHGR